MHSKASPILRAWVPVLLWLLVIALESTSLGSSEHTKGLLSFFLKWLDPHIKPARLLFLNALLRKIGHCLGYGMLSLLMLRAWWHTLRTPENATRPAAWRSIVSSWSARAAALALASTALVAALDEWHQLMIPKRTGTWRDVALDSMAAAFVQLAVIAFSDVKQKRGRAVRDLRMTSSS